MKIKHIILALFLCTQMSTSLLAQKENKDIDIQDYVQLGLRQIQKFR